MARNSRQATALANPARRVRVAMCRAFFGAREQDGNEQHTTRLRPGICSIQNHNRLISPSKNKIMLFRILATLAFAVSFDV
jgi:hypothetical protein